MIFFKSMNPWIIIFASVAFVVIVVVVGRELYRWSFHQPRMWKEAEQALPELAARLGLRFDGARRLDEIGVIDGMYEGYQVRITPDDRTLKFFVELHHRLDHGNAVVAGLGEEMGALIYASEAFSTQWGRRLRFMRIEPTAIECSPKDGTPDDSKGGSENERSYVTAAQVEAILPELVAVARTIDGYSRQ